MSETIRQITCVNGAAGRSLWAFIDSVRDEEGLSLAELSRRLGYEESVLSARKRRATGKERLTDIAELFGALGWDVVLTARKREE